MKINKVKHSLYVDNILWWELFRLNDPTIDWYLGRQRAEQVRESVMRYHYWCVHGDY